MCVYLYGVIRNPSHGHSIMIIIPVAKFLDVLNVVGAVQFI